MKVFIAVPCYDGKVVADCMQSIIKNIKTLETHGHDVIVREMSGCCYIQSTRNVLVKWFLESGCDEMVFVDNDLGFEDNAILKLINTGESVCLGAYPYRNNSCGFPIKIVPDPGYEIHTPLIKEVFGEKLIELIYGPTGLMKISRTVFVEMMEKHPEWEYMSSHGNLFSIFDTGRVSDNQKEYFGEDVAFCIRWREMGGHIYCLPNINFRHHGMMNSNGNLHEYLLNNKEAAEIDPNATITQQLDKVINSINKKFKKIQEMTLA